MAADMYIDAEVLDVRRDVLLDDAGAWKPSAPPYLHAARVMGVDPARLALVAVHGWDGHGAERAGLFEPPDVEGQDLVAVVERLLARS